jgi:FkbH-like protein
MVEPVRMVIWDLDDTFWKGTLSEGGIGYQQVMHNCVVELARRGIVSSICSKNDFDSVKAILISYNIWNFFIFPSINWEPKGQRIQSIIDIVQLRPSSVMLIDDNPMNLNEARHFVPEIQIASEKIIPTLLQNPLFRGKDDRTLSRLKQYKLLERRKADELAAGGDNRDFLRASDIRVEIIHDVESNIDRAIELINRTNQLNYTKRRLPENIAQARQALRDQINVHDVQAGLIRVSDRYGDHGICGYYATQTRSGHVARLDYCFSCRIVETWVFQLLGKPYITLVGDVLTKLSWEAPPVDWIRLSTAHANPQAAGAPSVGQIILHGGCDLMPLGLYFKSHAESVIGEFNSFRDMVEVRLDHSAILRLALEKPGPEALEALARFRYRPSDFETELGNESNAPEAVVLSFGVDMEVSLYRHKELGFRVPVLLPIDCPTDADVTMLDADTVERLGRGKSPRDRWAPEAIRELRDNYSYEGLISEAEFKDNLRRIVAAVPQSAVGFIIGLNERQRGGTPMQALWRHIQFNNWIKDVIADKKNIQFVNIREFVANENEVDATHYNHFSRMVYYRLFEHLLKKILLGKAAKTQALPAQNKAAGAVDMRGSKVLAE